MHRNLQVEFSRAISPSVRQGHRTAEEPAGRGLGRAGGGGAGQLPGGDAGQRRADVPHRRAQTTLQGWSRTVQCQRHRANTTAGTRASAVRSPRSWVSGYCTKWRIQGQFSLLVFTFVKRQDLAEKLNTYPLRFLITSNNLPQHKLCVRKRELALNRNINSTFNKFPWRIILTNGGDAKYIFPPCQSQLRFRELINCLTY